jgi:hypothetical protein
MHHKLWMHDETQFLGDTAKLLGHTEYCRARTILPHDVHVRQAVVDTCELGLSRVSRLCSIVASAVYLDGDRFRPTSSLIGCLTVSEVKVA